MEIISKELLSEVLEVEILEYEIKPKNTIKYIYNKKSNNNWSGKEFMNRSINIYELAHKCKEWALIYGFRIKTWISDKRCCYAEIENDAKSIFISMEYLGTQNTEPEAIFKACQWIYNKLQKESI